MSDGGHGGHGGKEQASEGFNPFEEAGTMFFWGDVLDSPVLDAEAFTEAAASDAFDAGMGFFLAPFQGGGHGGGSKSKGHSAGGHH